MTDGLSLYQLQCWTWDGTVGRPTLAAHLPMWHAHWPNWARKWSSLVIWARTISETR